MDANFVELLREKRHWPTSEPSNAAIEGATTEQLANARQAGDDVLDQAVDEVLLLWIAAHGLERKHSD